MTSVSDALVLPSAKPSLLRRPKATTGFWSWFTKSTTRRSASSTDDPLLFLCLGGIEAL